MSIVWDHGYIASDDVTLMYGIGDTEAEAIADYEDCVRELIEMLEGSNNPCDALELAAVRAFAREQGIIE